VARTSAFGAARMNLWPRADGRTGRWGTRSGLRRLSGRLRLAHQIPAAIPPTRHCLPNPAAGRKMWRSQGGRWSDRPLTGPRGRDSWDLTATGHNPHRDELNKLVGSVRRLRCGTARLIANPVAHSSRGAARQDRPERDSGGDPEGGRSEGRAGLGAGSFCQRPPMSRGGGKTLFRPQGRRG